MSAPTDGFDFFVSYARKDNANGWITQFLDALQAEHRAFSGGRQFHFFFDKEDIGSLDAWQHRIYDSLSASSLFLAFISPTYFASEWCRREWRTWIDVEIAKHILSDGAAPIYIVEVPWLGNAMSEQQVAEAMAQLTKTVVTELRQGLAADVLKVAGEMSLRQLTKAQPFYTHGLDALRREDLRRVLATLAKDLEDRARHIAEASNSPSTIPPYNRRFVGRLEELSRLRERLFQGRTGVISGHKEGELPAYSAGFASVHGLGGIGKTELAFTYAHAFAGLYPGGRFLIQCEHLTDLRRAMLQLDGFFADAVTDEQRKSLEVHFGAIREALRRQLRESGRILLLLDNVSDLVLLSPEQTDLIRLLGPQLHLLVTTRLGAPPGHDVHDEMRWITLGELTFDDSLRLLEKHRSFAEAECAVVEKIARRLGGFALCVEVVGAYLRQHLEESYAGFLERMGLGDLEQVDAAAEREETITRRHNNEKRLGAILALSMQKLTPAERTALEFASLLPPDHVVLTWLRELTAAAYPEWSGPGKDIHAAWQKIQRNLLNLALLTRGEEGNGDMRVVRCHRLVQDYVRSSMESLHGHSRQVLSLVKDRETVLNDSAAAGDTRHEIEALDALALQWQEQHHPLAGWLLHQAGLCWHCLGVWQRAEFLLRRSLLLVEIATTGDANDVSDRLNSLAEVLRVSNQQPEAERLFKRTIQLKQDSGDSMGLAAARNNYAELLGVSGRSEEAEPLLRRSIDIHGLHDTRRDFIPRNNLANLLRDSGRLQEAEAEYRRALESCMTSLGRAHPLTVTALENLAILLDRTGQKNEATALCREVLDLTRESYGDRHPDYARRLNNLATVLMEQGWHDEALDTLLQSSALMEEAHGPNHPNTLGVLCNLAVAQIQAGRAIEAEATARKSAKLHLKNFSSHGTAHPGLYQAFLTYCAACKNLDIPETQVFARLTTLGRQFNVPEETVYSLLTKAFAMRQPAS